MRDFIAIKMNLVLRKINEPEEKYFLEFKDA